MCCLLQKQKNEKGQPSDHSVSNHTRSRDIRLRIPVLLGHSEIDNMDDILPLGGRTSDQEVVGLDITVDQVLLVDGLDPGDLSSVTSSTMISLRPNAMSHRDFGALCTRLTICLATIQQVLTENLRPHMSNRSSIEGPKRSMTRMLCRPS
jgi:hypothetical protein